MTQPAQVVPPPTRQPPNAPARCCDKFGEYYTVPERDERPRQLPYYEGEPEPEGYRLVERPRRGLVIAGAITLGATYSLNLSVAMGTDFKGDAAWLALPVFGPWILMAEASGENADTGRSLLFFDGLVQAAGAAMLAVGLWYPTQVWVRQDGANLRLLPTCWGDSGCGVVAIGTM